MTTKRILLEVGTGNDWHGGDYTKATVRAVQDTLHHCSLTFLKTLDLDPNKLQVDVTVGVQKPEKVELELVKAELPHGQVKVNVVTGGLDIPNQGPDDITVIATVAIAVLFDFGA